MISAERHRAWKTVSIITAGIKETKRKRHLLYELREVYAMFWEEHGNNVSFRTLCNLRLVNLLLSRSTDHDMCLCQTHHQSDQRSTATIQSAMECWECSLSIWGRMQAQSSCNLQRRHKVEGSSARKARVWWRSWSVSIKQQRWRQIEKNQVDHASWWCCGGDPQCSTSILTPCVCEKVPGRGIPARNRRSSTAKCVVQIDFAENYTCASDSIHKGSFVVVHVHGVKARSVSNATPVTFVPHP